jgi:AcrR family transcriptional regulator
MAPLAAMLQCVNTFQEGYELTVAECQPFTRAELRRQNIKHVARRLFIEHGFHRTGIALIAKGSGVAVQQLYRDFPAKEDIIAAIVEEDCRRFADLAALEVALAEDDREMVRRWLMSCVSRKDAEDDRLFLEIAAESTRNDRIKSIFTKVRSAMSDNIAKALAGLTGDRIVRDDHRIAAEAYMIALIGSACTRALSDEDIHTPSQKLLLCLIDEKSAALRS